MPEFKEYDPGTFCYAELVTSDSTVAKEFYGKLFGWTYQDEEIPGLGIYTQTHLNGKVAGAMYKLTPEMEGAGVPPHWGHYITVADLDASCARVAELGGTVAMGPRDVSEVGRMAAIVDPTGASVNLWQPKQHHGLEVRDENNTMCWNELMTGDTAAAAEFYQALLGWTANESDMAGRPYTVFFNNGKTAGGMMSIEPEMGPIPAHWLMYFAVANCDLTTEAATGTGGKVLVPPTDLPNVGRFAILQDPGGVVFGIVTMETQSG